MKKFYVFFFAIMILASCSLEDDGAAFEIKTLPIKEAILPESFEFGDVYNIKLIYDLPNACHSFRNVYSKNEDSKITLAINTEVNNDTSCTEEVIEQEYTFSISITQREDYIFMLWKGVDEGGENIFEEIVVPVVDVN